MLVIRVFTNQFGYDSISCRVIVDSSKTIISDTQLSVEYTENIQIFEHRFSRSYAKPVKRELTLMKPKFIGKIEQIINKNESKAIHLKCRVETNNDFNVTIDSYR